MQFDNTSEYRERLSNLQARLDRAENVSFDLAAEVLAMTVAFHAAVNQNSIEPIITYMKKKGKL